MEEGILHTNKHVSMAYDDQTPEEQLVSSAASLTFEIQKNNESYPKMTI